MKKRATEKTWSFVEVTSRVSYWRRTAVSGALKRELELSLTSHSYWRHRDITKHVMVTSALSGARARAGALPHITHTHTGGVS